MFFAFEISIGCCW